MADEIERIRIRKIRVTGERRPLDPRAVKALAQSMRAQGDKVFGASCVGVGQGSLQWSEEALKALEVGVVGGFGRACRAAGITRFALLSAVGR